jgi:peroxiredoxin
VFQLRTVASGAVAVCLLFAGCTTSGNKPVKAAEPSVSSPGSRKRAPDFTLKDSDGKTVSLSDYKGKVVLLNFWATWCGPCKIEIPWFIEFEQKYKDNGFAVLGVSMDDDGWTAVKPFMADKHINYRMVVGSESVSQLYGGVESLPTTFVIDRNGMVAASHEGLVSKSDYQNEILQLLDSKSAGLSGTAHASSGAN